MNALLFAAVVLLAAMADISVPVMAEGQEAATDAGESVFGRDVLDGSEGSGEQGAGISSAFGGDAPSDGEISGEQDAGIFSVSGGYTSGSGEVSSGQETGTSFVSGGDMPGSGEASNRWEAGISSVSSGDISGGEVSNGQNAGVSSVSGGDAAGGAVESGMSGVYSMALADSDHSGTAYGIDWMVADGVLTLTGAAEGSPSEDGVTDDNYTEVWPWLAYISEYSSVVADCVMPENCTRFFSGVRVSEFTTGAGFDAGNIRCADSMFRSAVIPVLDISAWKPAGLYSIYGMFYAAEIDTLNMSGWDFSHLKNYTYIMDRGMGNVNSSMMFLGAAVKHLDWSCTDWTGQYTIPSVDGRAAGADIVSHVETVDLSHVTAPQAYHFMTGYTNLWHYSHNDFGGYVGNGMTGLVFVDLSYSDFSNVTTLDSCFEDASALASVNFEGIKLGVVTTTESMFEDCASLPGVDISPIPFGSVTTTESMFQGCKKLQSGQLLGVDTRDYGSVTTMNSMFRDSGIITADFFRGLKLDKVVAFESVFRGCDKLVECDLSGIDFSALTSISQLFYGCRALPETGVNVSGITVTDAFKKLSYAFYGCSAMKNFEFLGELDTAGCTDWSYAFSYCTGLDKLLDLGLVDMGAMAEARNLFGSNTSVEVIYIPTVRAECNIYGIVIGCTNLKRLKVNDSEAGWKVKGATGLDMADLTDMPPALYVDPYTFLSTDEFIIHGCAATCTRAGYYSNGGKFPEGTEVTAYGVHDYYSRYVYSVSPDDSLNRSILYEDYPVPEPVRDAADGCAYEFAGWTGTNGRTVSRNGIFNNNDESVYPVLAGDGPTGSSGVDRVAKYTSREADAHSIVFTGYEDCCQSEPKASLAYKPDISGITGSLAAGEAKYSQTVYLYFPKPIDAQYALDGFVVNGGEVEVKLYRGNVYCFTMPDEDVEITVDYTFTEHNTYSICDASYAGSDVPLGNITTPESAMYGESVELRGSMNDGYYIYGVEANGVLYKGTSFTMPDEDVTSLVVQWYQDYKVEAVIFLGDSPYEETVPGNPLVWKDGYNGEQSALLGEDVYDFTGEVYGYLGGSSSNLTQTSMTKMPSSASAYIYCKLGPGYKVKGFSLGDETQNVYGLSVSYTYFGASYSYFRTVVSPAAVLNVADPVVTVYVEAEKLPACSLTADVAHGEVEFFSDAGCTEKIRESQAKEMVYMRITPEAGYRAAVSGYNAAAGETEYYVGLRNSSGAEIPDGYGYGYIRQGNGYFYFYMPAADTVVGGSLPKEKYALSVRDAGNGDGSHGHAGYKTEGMEEFVAVDGSFEAGTRITVGAVDVAAGYEVTWEVMASDGPEIEWVDEDTFLMPAAGVEIRYRVSAVCAYVVSLPASVELKVQAGKEVMAGEVSVGIRYLIPDGGSITVEPRRDSLVLESEVYSGMCLGMECSPRAMAWTNGTEGTEADADGWRIGEDIFTLTAEAEPGKWKGTLVVVWSHSE